MWCCTFDAALSRYCIIWCYLVILHYFLFLSYRYPFLLLYICRLIFVDCIFISFQYILKEQLILRRNAREHSFNIFKMQLIIDYSSSFILWSVVQQCHARLACLFQCTPVFRLKMYKLKKQKVDNNCVYFEHTGNISNKVI